MFLEMITKVVQLYEGIFAPIDVLIKKIPLDYWIIDAFIDIIHLAPFLFVIFALIEWLEQFYSDKIKDSMQKAGKSAVIIGSIASILPQCGFSVIAASLYSKKYITRGVLIAVFLTTSDETIPILLANPEKASLVIPIVLYKLGIGIFFGYLIDFLSKTKVEKAKGDIVIEEGCCRHEITKSKREQLLYHPIKHTFNISCFILIVTLFLNYCFSHYQITEIIVGGSFVQPIIASLVGLIPNCAISVGITIMLIKGTITLGSAMSGLLANAGLGLLILFKNNNLRDNLIIITLLFMISTISGWIINYLM